MSDLQRQRIQELREELKRLEDDRALACHPMPGPDQPKGASILELWSCLDEALRLAQREMGIEPDEEELAPVPPGLCPMLTNLEHRLHIELDRARQVLCAIKEAKAHLDGGATER